MGLERVASVQSLGGEGSCCCTSAQPWEESIAAVQLGRGELLYRLVERIAALQLEREEGTAVPVLEKKRLAAVRVQRRIGEGNTCTKWRW